MCVSVHDDRLSDEIATVSIDDGGCDSKFQVDLFSIEFDDDEIRNTAGTTSGQTNDGHTQIHLLAHYSTSVLGYKRKRN